MRHKEFIECGHEGIYLILKGVTDASTKVERTSRRYGWCRYDDTYPQHVEGMDGAGMMTPTHNM